MTASPAPDLSPAQAATLARIEATPAAPESFDATAALRRVLALADDLDDGSDWGTVEHPGYEIRDRIRAAVNGDPS